jgi:hypothetical protein
MKTIDQLVAPDKQYNDLMLARGYAINGFVQLESSLAGLYQGLAGGDALASHWAFFKLTSQHRFEALLQLGKRRDANAMNPFGESLLQACARLTTARNFIVHAQHIRGAMQKDVRTGQEKRLDNFLSAPGFMFDLETEKKYVLSDVMDFIVRTQFARENVTLLDCRFRGITREEWSDILTTKFEWLPPTGHPAHSMWKEAQIQQGGRQ